MTLTRLLPLALALASAGTLMACATPPSTPMSMPMGAGPGHAMASPDHTAAMDAQMKTMHDMHVRMTNARTPEERQSLMAAHMKAMQGGMGMMKGMAAMHDAKGVPPAMAEHHKMMAQRMEMMQMMMDMMAQRMPPVAGTQ
jgi:hypothetical protein